MFHVLIVEDHSLVAEAAAHKISNSPRSPVIEVCATADDALSALRSTPEKWQLILLDLNVPGAHGLSLASEIARMGLAARTCILTGAERPEFEIQAVEMGFQGYLLKGGGTSVSTLEEDLSRIVAGERVFRRSGTAEQLAAPHLTKRQAQCLGLAATGLTSKEIARELELHPGTVDRCINGAMLELQCNSRAQAIARALELGLITVPERN